MGGVVTCPDRQNTKESYSMDNISFPIRNMKEAILCIMYSYITRFTGAENE